MKTSISNVIFGHLEVLKFKIFKGLTPLGGLQRPPNPQLTTFGLSAEDERFALHFDTCCWPPSKKSLKKALV